MIDTRLRRAAYVVAGSAILRVVGGCAVPTPALVRTTLPRVACKCPAHASNAGLILGTNASTDPAVHRVTMEVRLLFAAADEPILRAGHRSTCSAKTTLTGPTVQTCFEALLLIAPGMAQARTLTSAITMCPWFLGFGSVAAQQYGAREQADQHPEGFATCSCPP
jgi:hypothetical protein